MSAPSAPQVFHQPLASDQTLEFSWQPPLSDGGEAINGYRITITPAGGSPIVQYPDASALYWKETGLTNNTWYEISLEAGNPTYGYGAAAFFRSFQPGSKPDYPPASATAAVFGENGALVSWTAPTTLPDATIYWYAVYARSSDPADPEVSAGGDGQTETSIVVEGLNPASSYYFEVYAVNCPGYSPVAVTGTINFGLASGRNYYGNVFAGEQATFLTPNQVKKDVSKNTYVIAPYSATERVYLQDASGTSQIESGVSLPPSGFSAYLAKYDVNGAVQWATTIGIATPTTELTVGSYTPRGLAIDSANNIYTLGTIVRGSTYTLYDASGTGQVASAVTLPVLASDPVGGANFMALIKYNSNGQVQWATYVAPNNSATGYSVTTDASNNVIIAGLFNISVSYTIPQVSGTGQADSSYGFDISGGFAGQVLIKYNAAGQVQWATFATSGFSTGTVSTTRTLKTGLVVDTNGDIYWARWANEPTPTIYNASGTGQAASSITATGNSFQISTLLIKYTSTGQAVWAASITGTENALMDLVLDAAANSLYMVGYYTAGAQTINDASGNGQVPSSVTLPTLTNAAAMLLKFNLSGVCQWATYLNGSGTDTANAVGIDSAGDVYIAGGYIATATVTVQNVSGSGQAPSSYTLPLTATSSWNGFLIKYNASGVCQWATTTTNLTTQGVVTGGLHIDASNNIVVGGSYGGITSQITLQNASGFGQAPSSYTLLYTYPEAGPSTSLRATNGYIVQYNTSGQVQWATCAKGYNIRGSTYGIQTDASGNQYIAGFLVNSKAVTLKDVSGTTLVDSAFTIPAVTTDSEAYFILMKYNKEGQCQWATYVANIGAIGPTSRQLVLDGSNIYFTGVYQKSSGTQPTLYNVSGTGQVASSVTLPLSIGSSAQTAFVVKYTTSGQAVWATHLSATSNTYNCQGYDVKVDSVGNVYWSGTYASAAQIFAQDVSGSTQTNSTITLPLTPTTNARAFIMKYNPQGIVQWATFVPNNLSTVWSLAIDAFDNVYAAGTMGTTGAAINLRDASGNTQTGSAVTIPGVGAFFFKLNSSGIVQWGTNVFKDAIASTVFSLHFDESNGIYITGQYLTLTQRNLSDVSGTTQAQSPVTLPLTSSGTARECPFLVKYNQSGVAQWAINIPLNLTSANTLVGGYDIGTNGTSVYIVGRYLTPSSLTPTPLTLKDASGNGQTDSTITLPYFITSTLFLIRYSHAGICQWAVNLPALTVIARELGTSTAPTVGPNALTMGPENTIYVTGVYSSGNDPYIQDADGTGQTNSTMQLPSARALALPLLLKYAA
jgi:hypothetical protein